MPSIATASANIALVKYWGKRDLALNLPAAGSLSLTLDNLRTYTQVELHDGDEDVLVLDGKVVSGRPRDRLTDFFALIRADGARRAKVTTRNRFPSSAGLASSASGFAALAVAACDAYGVSKTASELSVLARRGSGSAARSIFSGYAVMDEGTDASGEDAFARPLEDTNLPLAAAISVVDAGEKDVSSTEGMERTRKTSPYHEAWINQVNVDLEAAIAALRDGDFDRLAPIVEGSCLAMHADAMAARPGIIYFKPATLWAIDTVRSLRASGTPVMFTIDAGPHVVAFTPPAHLDTVAAALGDHPDIAKVVVSQSGEGATLLDEVPAELSS